MAKMTTFLFLIVCLCSHASTILTFTSLHKLITSFYLPGLFAVRKFGSEQRESRSE